MKKIVFLMLFLFIASTLSACSDKAGRQNQENSKNSEDFSMRRPDFGQPEEKPAISGLVKSVIGNEITILKIDRPQRNSQETDSAAVNNESQPASQERTAPAIGMGGATGGRFSGANRGDRNGSWQQDPQQQAQMLEAIKKMSSGEEKIIVPVGIQMLKRSEDASAGLEMTEATLADIKQDKMVQIWLSESSDDRKIASFVMITR